MKAKHINPKQKRLLIVATITLFVAALVALVIPMIASNAQALEINGVTYEVTADQQATYDEMIANGASAEEVNAFIATLPVAGNTGVDSSTTADDEADPENPNSPQGNDPLPSTDADNNTHMLQFDKSAKISSSDIKMNTAESNNLYFYIESSTNKKLYAHDVYTGESYEGNPDLVIDWSSDGLGTTKTGVITAPYQDKSLLCVFGGDSNDNATHLLVMSDQPIVSPSYGKCFTKDDYVTYYIWGDQNLAILYINTGNVVTQVDLDGGTLDEAQIASLVADNWKPISSNSVWEKEFTPGMYTCRQALNTWLNIAPVKEYYDFDDFDPVIDDSKLCQSTTYIAQYTRQKFPVNIDIKIDPDSAEMGTVSGDFVGLKDEGYTYKIDYNTITFSKAEENVTPIVATAFDDYMFGYWLDKDGKRLEQGATGPVSDGMRFVAHFVNKNIKAVTVNSNYPCYYYDAIKDVWADTANTTWNFNFEGTSAIVLRANENGDTVLDYLSADGMPSHRIMFSVDKKEFLKYNNDTTKVTKWTDDTQTVPEEISLTFDKPAPPTPVDPSDSSTDSSSGAQGGTAASTGTQTGDSIASVVAIAVCAMTAAICGYVLINRRRVIGKHVK